MTAGDARAARIAQRLLARLPARADVSLGTLGSVTIALVGPVASDGLRPHAASFGVGRAVIEGRLSIDAGLGRRLVAAALGEGVASSEASLSMAPLSFGERGLLAGLVARVLDQLRAPVTVALEAPARAHQIGSDALVLALDITAVGSRGWGELEVPARWVEELARAPLDAAALAALTVVARLELGRTFLRGAELAALEPGDAVVFDGQAAPQASQASQASQALEADGWRVSIVIGDAAAIASLSPSGRLKVEGAFGRPRARATNAANNSEEATMPIETAREEQGERAEHDDTTRIDVTALLAAAPIEVVAEVGRIVLRGEEVLGLGPGSVLTLGGARTAEVTLRVGDEVWAEGELVDVDGALAVRVTRVARPPSARR